MMLFNVDFGISNSIIGDWDTVMWLGIKRYYSENI